jgi:hypothetical protein
MIERAEQLQRRFFQPGLAPAPAVNWEPPVDVFESEQELTIVAALPGVDRRTSSLRSSEACCSSPACGACLPARIARQSIAWKYHTVALSAAFGFPAKAGNSAVPPS